MKIYLLIRRNRRSYGGSVEHCSTSKETIEKIGGYLGYGKIEEFDIIENFDSWLKTETLEQLDKDQLRVLGVKAKKDSG